MANNELTYNDFLQRLNIQELLVDAGYQLNKRDGLRYPSYVKVDSHGQRVRGDKFIVTGNGKCCFLLFFCAVFSHQSRRTTT